LDYLGNLPPVWVLDPNYSSVIYGPSASTTTFPTWTLEVHDSFMTTVNEGCF
jgi:hypothetical protein